MSTPNIYFASSAADVAGIGEYALLGDFILDTSTNHLYVQGTNGPAMIAIPAATHTVLGSVKEGANVTALTDNTGGTVSQTLAAVTVPATITDSTGGSASTTFAPIAAGLLYIQSDGVAIKNALAQIVLNLNASNTAYGVLKNSISSLAAEVNAIRAQLVASGQMVGP